MRGSVLVASFLFAAACHAHATHGEGHATRSFPVGAFDAVALAGSDDVRVVTGAPASVVASGPPEVLDRLDIRTEGGTLRIGRKPGGWHFGWRHKRGAMVTVTTPGIGAAAVAGSGTISVDHARGDAFKGSVAGSGGLTLADVREGRVTLDVAGSGDLSAAGTAQDARLDIAGSGNIDANALVSQTADIAIGGSGNGGITARRSATISVAGSGNATVRGTTDCRISKTGSGEARCIP